MARRLVCLGYGYVAQALSRILSSWTVHGTHRDRPLRFDGVTVSDELLARLAEADAVLASIPPDDEGDPALRVLGAALPAGAWLGYLSTTGVYGDRDGGWSFEDDQPTPSSPVAVRRVVAERQWLGRGAHVFRLPGIYGPGRSAFDRIAEGDVQRIVKPGQVFSRAHVDDIANALAMSIARPNPGRIYNICDDEPAPPQDVTGFAANLLGVTLPPEVAMRDAQLSPAAARFYADNKRVSNARAKAELGWRPKYPGYREGLEAIRASQSV